MVKSGTVVRIDSTKASGLIEDKNGREYFFHVSECCEGKMPKLWSSVTFVKDPDFKSTNVASLVKLQEICPYRQSA